jgi:hypothetical protein
MEGKLQPVIRFQALTNRDIGQKRRIRRYFRPISGQICKPTKTGLLGRGFNGPGTSSLNFDSDDSSWSFLRKMRGEVSVLVRRACWPDDGGSCEMSTSSSVATV